MNSGAEINDVPLFMANRVLDNIFVGGMYAAEDEDFIHTNRVERIINCCYHRYPNRFGHLGVRYLNFSFEEDGSSVIFDQRDENITLVVRFLQEAVEADDCVLIASANGESRSVILLAGYLIHRFHWPCQRALQFITTKRFNAKPHPAYLRQLIEFANRRKAKYGAHKDIFGNIRGLKLNQQEYLHRNTFLNSIMSQPAPEETLRHKSIRSVLGLFLKSFAGDVEPNPEEGNDQSQPNPQKKVRHVMWRDTLTTSTTNYSNDEINGSMMNNAQASALFRPRNPSYKSMQQIKCVPVRLDTTIPPSVSFDLPTPGQVRRTDGYLSSKQFVGYAVCARPVSILKCTYKNSRGTSDEYSTIVRVEDYEREVIQELKRISDENNAKSQAVINAIPEQPLDKRRPQSVDIINQQQLQMQKYQEQRREAEMAKATPYNAGPSGTISIRNSSGRDDRHISPATGTGFITDNSKHRVCDENGNVIGQDGNRLKLGPTGSIRPSTPPKKPSNSVENQMSASQMEMLQKDKFKRQQQLELQKGLSNMTISNSLSSSSRFDQQAGQRVPTQVARTGYSAQPDQQLSASQQQIMGSSSRFGSFAPPKRPMSVSTGQLNVMRNSGTGFGLTNSSQLHQSQYSANRQVPSGVQSGLGGSVRFSSNRPHSVKVQNSTQSYIYK